MDDLGVYKKSVQETLRHLDQRHLSERIWKKDSSLWKSDPIVQEKIKNRLGWLTIAGEMTKKLDEINTFTRSVQASGVTSLVLIGMGGSSLCPEVLGKTFGEADGVPRLIVLDTSDPQTILNTERNIDLEHTLFLLASKSGTTIEMKSLTRYFAEKVRAMTGAPIGEHFAAITDPGSPLEALAKEERFRKIFLAPPDVGGRYSALTYFGLVPAALIGIDLVSFLKRAQEMIQHCSASLSAGENQGIQLGAILGTLGNAGRDKVTLIASESISNFGIWVEQLIAESTGKEGRGLVPIVGEAIGPSEIYGNDRLFVYLRVETDKNEALDQEIEGLQKAGHPIVRIDLRDRLDLAGEFFRWKMASAVAGIVLEVNPFDEPNVSESKENTAKILAEFEMTGQLTLPNSVMMEEGIGLAGNLNEKLPKSLDKILKSFLSESRPNHYIALMAYLAPIDTYNALLQTLRKKIRDKYHVATTLGYGPRFLHSTGQLHKGGAGNGHFIQITTEDSDDIQIPETTYSFGVLKRAQALGDFHSLIRHGVPVLDIRLGKDIEIGLKQLLVAI